MFALPPAKNLETCSCFCVIRTCLMFSVIYQCHFIPQNSYAVKFYMISKSNCMNIVDVLSRRWWKLGVVKIWPPKCPPPLYAQQKILKMQSWIFWNWGSIKSLGLVKSDELRYICLEKSANPKLCFHKKFKLWISKNTKQYKI